MPNHVYNGLFVEGSEEAIASFKAKALNVPSHHPEEDTVKEFSYWNFITPPQEALDSGEYWGMNGFQEGSRVGDTDNNWYNFNIREWDTKWDAYDIQIHTDEPTELNIQWCSAWSPPMAVFEAIASQHPDLKFDFDWEEEQGWGGEAKGRGGYFSITNHYDAPETHADHVIRDQTCACEWSEHEEDWYDDCPRADKIQEALSV